MTVTVHPADRKPFLLPVRSLRTEPSERELDVLEQLVHLVAYQEVDAGHALMQLDLSGYTADAEALDTAADEMRARDDYLGGFVDPDPEDVPRGGSVHDVREKLADRHDQHLHDAVLRLAVRGGCIEAGA